MEGTPFGRYQLQALIGRGGMGEVWRAFDTETHRTVAIKLLPTQMASDEEFTERFRREARVAAGLNSPNVVPIHNFGEIDGRLYVDMALIDGRDLQAVLDEGPMHPQRAVLIIEQVAAALRDAHAAGLVHRDVKPSNILLNADDFAYLIDFGLARTDEDAGLTVTGHTVGTFAYMAPERYEGRPVDSRTDIYSLACVLYQCLTGKRPFAGSGAQQMLAHVSTAPPRPSDTVPNLPRGFDAVVAIGMAKDVNARYPTMDEFARATRQALMQPQGPVGPPTQAWGPPPGPPPQQYRPPAPQYSGAPQFVAPKMANTPWFRRKPVLVMAACLVVAVIAVTAVVFTTTGSGGGGDTTTSAAPKPVNWGQQVAMPADELNNLQGIAVSETGNIVGLCCTVGPDGTARDNVLFSIAADMQSPPKLTAFHQGMSTGSGIASDGKGNGYFAVLYGPVFRADGDTGKFVELDFPKTTSPEGLAVDGSGAVYVINRAQSADSSTITSEVWKLEAGATESTTLPFDGRNVGDGIAVASDGTVYVTAPGKSGLLKLPPGAAEASLVEFPERPEGVAVDADGAVYAATRGVNGDDVYRLPAGADKPEKLPFSGVTFSDIFTGIAVDQSGSVFVADFGGNRVVKLPRLPE